MNSSVGPVQGAMLNAIVGLMFRAIVPLINQQLAPGAVLSCVLVVLCSVALYRVCIVCCVAEPTLTAP